MIKETTNKINFIAYRPTRGRAKNVNDAPTITLFVSKGKIQFNRYALEQMQMQGKFVRFFYEPVKKVIGWKVESQVSQNDMKLWRVCRTHENGVWLVSVQKMLDLFQLGRKGLAPTYRNMEVKKYRNVEMLSAPNDTYFYVELKEEYAEREKKEL